MTAAIAQPTYEDVARLLHELARRSEEADRRSKEADRRSKEADLRSKEADRRIEETDRQMQEAARRFKETERLIETNAEKAAIERRETDRQIREMSRKIGDLGNRLGDFVQEMVRPTVVKLFRERGFDVHEVYPNISVKRNGGLEVDLFVVNDRQAIAVECKSHAAIDDVNEHLERLEKFKDFFPRYRDVELMGAVAAMVMPDNVARYAYRKGLYVLAQSGEMVEVRNDGKFKPRFW